jgi:2-amino-4-hydroxy-6-hydroxymethyldihydropteridine diphosphokinase
MAHTVYLALGTNLGDRLANLKTAINDLAPGVNVKRASSVFETEPWGYADQPWFLNQVLEAETEFSPEELLQYLKKLERDLGRTPSFHYGPRLIDIDVLFYDDLVLETPQLEIPHPQVAERSFVLVPLADLAPDLCHPVLGVTMHELLEKVGSRGVFFYADSEGNRKK